MGTKKWISQYRLQYPDEDQLREECENYMSEFDKRELQKTEREKEMFETPDEVNLINQLMIDHPKRSVFILIKFGVMSHKAITKILQK